MTRWSVLVCGLAVWLAACGPLEGQAVLMTDDDAYPPGAELTLQLHNDSVRELGYNLCGAQLQRYGEAGWEAVPGSADEVCQAIQLQLGPGAVGTDRRTLDGALPAGQYRFLTHVEWDGERQEVASAPFLVVQQ